MSCILKFPESFPFRVVIVLYIKRCGFFERFEFKLKLTVYQKTVASKYGYRTHFARFYCVAIWCGENETFRLK